MRDPSTALVEAPDQPPRTHHLRAEGFRSPSQFTIRRDQCHIGIGSRDDRDERVVTTAGRVHDGDPVVRGRLGTVTCLTLQDDDDGLVEPSGVHRGTEPLQEFPSRSRTIPPPPVGTGADHVRRIDQEHSPSLPASSAPPFDTGQPGRGLLASSEKAVGGPWSMRFLIATAHSRADWTEVSTSRS